MAKKIQQHYKCQYLLLLKIARRQSEVLGEHIPTPPYASFMNASVQPNRIISSIFLHQKSILITNLHYIGCKVYSKILTIRQIPLLLFLLHLFQYRSYKRNNSWSTTDPNAARCAPGRDCASVQWLESAIGHHWEGIVQHIVLSSSTTKRMSQVVLMACTESDDLSHNFTNQTCDLDFYNRFHTQFKGTVHTVQGDSVL